MNQTAVARQHLISKGFDGLRYNGGLNMNMQDKHHVYLAYNPRDITILKLYRLVVLGHKEELQEEPR
jgi:hypothetical protein